MRAAAEVPPIPGSARSGVVMTPVPYQSHTPNTEERAGDVDATKWVWLHNVFIPTMLLCASKTRLVCAAERTLVWVSPAPGGNNLSSALNRLSLRRQNFLCERQFFQAEREQKLQELAAAESEGGGSGQFTNGKHSLVFTNLSEFSISSSCFKTFLPEKLQIVKPLEGE